MSTTNLCVRSRYNNSQRPLVSLALLLLFSSLAQSFIFSNPFNRRYWSKRALTLNMVTTESPASSPAQNAESLHSIPNWRVLRKPTEDSVQETIDILRKRPAWSKERYQHALQLFERLMSCTDSYVSGAIEVALHSLDHAYRLYGPNSVICSFNGGKDAVAILHLVLAAHANYFHHQEQLSMNETVVPIRPRIIYFENKDEFPEVTEFLRETVETEDLDMIVFEEGVGFSQGLRVLVDHNYPDANSAISYPLAFVLGTRTTDPNAGGQGHFSPSSHYMPPFMRVNPILDWTYGHVWHFLRTFQLPYCVLYDRGYTSLGNMKNTLPCPALAVAGDNPQVPKYWPAYMLRDWDQERAGRIDTKKKKPKSENITQATNETSDESTRTSRLSGMTKVGPVASDPVKNVTKAEDVFVNGITPITPCDAESNSSCPSFSQNTLTQKTVGILIIGDEILKGFTADTNTQSAATALRNHNVLLKRVAVVSDSMEDICDEIARMQNEVDVIITSGGVGPTHDDVTIKSVAAALNCELTMHTEMLQLLQDKMVGTGNITEAQSKMAMLPSISKLRYLSDNPDDWPVLQCRNIFILPGIPKYFEQKIANVASYLSCQLRRGIAYKVILSVEENNIVPMLNQVVQNHPDVVFGSYPFVNHPEMKTVITVEGRLSMDVVRKNSSVYDEDDIACTSSIDMDRFVQLALDELMSLLPKGSVLRVDNDNMALSFN